MLVDRAATTTTPPPPLLLPHDDDDDDDDCGDDDIVRDAGDRNAMVVVGEDADRTNATAADAASRNEAWPRRRGVSDMIILPFPIITFLLLQFLPPTGTPR
jgi:hypothetical protein